MDGILLFDKPSGWTSHDAVDFVRRAAGQRAVGHAGTLDPMATGLLVLLLGSATKQSETFSGMDKDYQGTFRLGIETDTQDLEGKALRQSDPSAVTESAVAEALTVLRGVIDQVPPAYSAVKVGGKKSYEWARAGKPVEIKSRRVTVERFDLLEYKNPEVGFFVRCSKGTYVRTLCHQAGRALGCGAALSSLRRLRVGPYHLEKALRREDFEALNSFELEKRLVGA